MKKIGLALSGGGARGIAHIAFLKVFDELKIKPHMIAGTSIGAVIGAMYASGCSGKEIEEHFNKFTFNGIKKNLSGFSLKNMGQYFKSDKVIFNVKHILKCKTFEELDIPLKVVATDFWERKEKVFEKGDIIDALKASIAIPGMLPPVKIGNNVYIDGGASNPLPYNLLKKECEVVIAIDISEEDPVQKTKVMLPNYFEIIFSSFHIMQKNIVNEMLKYDKPDIYIKPPVSNIKSLEFHKQKKILQAVEKDAKEFKRKLKKLM
ncbi:MAG: patatin-like phospholipase family protein [archaeon]